MWIFTPLGFFSAVEHRDDPDSLLVRGRVRNDIDALAVALGTIAETQHTPQADYPYRLHVSKSEFSSWLARAVQGIDYDNFKNEVAHAQGRMRASLYGEVWSVMHNAERKVRAR